MQDDTTTRTIPLTQGESSLVDAADFPMLSRWSWCLTTAGYAITCVGRNRLVLMHRMLLLPEKRQQVDHRNGDPLDNRRNNLRVCTAKENQQNARKHRHCRGEACASVYKGVTWYEPYGLWRARLGVDGANRFLGYFTTEREAAAAYDEAATEEFGEFARINLTEED